MMVMKSLKSKDFCEEMFNWHHNYYTLKNEGMEYLRDYLRLPPTVFPATLTKKTPARAQRAGPEADAGAEVENWRVVSEATLCFSSSRTVTRSHLKHRKLSDGRLCCVKMTTLESRSGKLFLVCAGNEPRTPLNGRAHRRGSRWWRQGREGSPLRINQIVQPSPPEGFGSFCWFLCNQKNQGFGSLAKWILCV